ncbi:hypothetical protein KGP36_07665 [Patescibacteria group bacterium]|nr:hypothetical protein [Patescibacteria group bacterium]
MGDLGDEGVRGGGLCGEGAVEDERVRTEFLELFPYFRLVVALRQNTGLFTALKEIHDRFEPIDIFLLQKSNFVL